MSNFKFAIRTAAVFAVTLSLASCSRSNGVPTYPVEGKLLFKGEAAPGAFVVLHPVGESPAKVLPSARVAPDGSFQVGTFSAKDGAPEGEYVVTVEWRKLIVNGRDAVAGPNVLPAEFSSPEKSKLRVKVAKGNNELPLQLSSADADHS